MGARGAQRRFYKSGCRLEIEAGFRGRDGEQSRWRGAPFPMEMCIRDRPNDCAVEPHELTHAPDALRYLFVLRPYGRKKGQSEKTRLYYSEVENLLAYGT